jgi:hypothetical protein
LSRSLTIDFAPRRWRMTAAAWLLFALGVVTVAAWIDRAGEFRNQIAQAMSELSALHPSAARDEHDAARTVTHERARSVNDAIRRLNTPWETIFAALSTASTPQVALLSLEPDVAASVAHLMVETRSTEAMFALQRRLAEQPGIVSAAISRHEVRSDNPGAPVRFWIEARWEAR